MIFYYPSGKVIKKRDRIWIDEGRALAFVESIFSNDLSYDKSGYTEPSIVTSLLNPDYNNSILIGYPLNCFKEEGIDLPSDEELLRIKNVEKYIVNSLSFDINFCAFFNLKDHHQQFKINVVHYGTNNNPEKIIKIIERETIISDCENDLSVLPHYAWPINGGGPIKDNDGVA